MGRVTMLRIGSYLFKVIAFLLLVLLIVRGFAPLTLPGLLLGLVIVPGPFFLIGVLPDTIADMSISIEAIEEKIESIEEKMEDTNKRVIWLQKKLSSGIEPQI